MLISYSCSTYYQENTILFKTSFTTVIHMHLFFILVEKNETSSIHSEQPLFCSQRPGSMVFLCLVQRFLDKHKESGPPKCECDLNNFRFDNYCF